MVRLDSTFYGLIPDLQNLICEYAYKTDRKTLSDEVNTAVMINSWDLPPCLVRQSAYSTSERYFAPSALRLFRLSSDYGGYRKLFHWDNVYTLLYHLDFRLKVVRTWGSREDWHNKISIDWRNIAYFSFFFVNSLQKTIDNYLKPSSCKCLPCHFYGISLT